jgi:transposase-like protein
MEARFNEKVREFQDLIAAFPDRVAELETEMYEYMARTAPFIKEYHKESTATTSTKTVANIKISSRKGVQRQDIYNAYLAEIEEVHGQAKTTDKYRRPCPNCGANFSFTFDESQSEDSCIECGYVEYVQGEEVGFKEEQEMEKNIVYSYKRENHFNEWVSQFQAKESTSVPPEVIDQLRAEFKKQKIKELSEITHEKVETHVPSDSETI